jgi:hypothetical protein
MENSTRKFGYFIETLKLPTGNWLQYRCFRSTVNLDAAMFLFKQKEIRTASNNGDVKFEQSYFRSKNSITPGIQISAAFNTKEDFDRFDVAWNEGMANAEIRRIKNARLYSGGEHGGTFLSKYLDKEQRMHVWTAKELVKEFFEGEYMQEMNTLIDRTLDLVKVRERQYGITVPTLSDDEVSAYEHNQMNYEA